MGAAWRLHLAYDCTAGRLGQVQGTDRRGGEHLGRSQGQAGDGMVADRGYGDRRRGALAVRQQAEGVLRLHPAPCPLATDAEQPFAVLRWLRPRGETARDGHGWWRGQGPRRKAQTAGRTITAPTLAGAGWLLVMTTLAAAPWSPTDVLCLSRARWHVALVWKKMQQRRRRNPIRSQHLTSVEATVRARLLAWALHEATTTRRRTLLSASTPPAMTVVSSGRRSGLGRDTRRQQVQGSWSEARLQACLPRLRRWLWSRPRRRGHQETTVRAGLAPRARAHPDRQRKVA